MGETSAYDVAHQILKALVVVGPYGGTTYTLKLLWRQDSIVSMTAPVITRSDRYGGMGKTLDNDKIMREETGM